MDRARSATDIFVPIEPNRSLHPQFEELINSPGYKPARCLISKLMEEFHDQDGNFIEQFQTYGFDARVFELGLFALLRERGFEFIRGFNRPDFIIRKDGIEACIEAVTATSGRGSVPAPYTHEPKVRNAEENDQYLLNDLVIQIGSPIFSKLKKGYQDLKQCANKPFVIAVQNFNGPGALRISSGALSRYLFGLHHNWSVSKDGILSVNSTPVERHVSGTKVIPSGFFNLPGTEFISGILFCNSLTIAAFNRIGHQGEFHDPEHITYRHGTSYRWDKNATVAAGFFYTVGDGYVIENWRQGTSLIRNPNALHPLGFEWLGAGEEQDLIDSNVRSTFAEPFFPYMSVTQIINSDVPDEFKQIYARAVHEELKPFPPQPWPIPNWGMVPKAR